MKVSFYLSRKYGLSVLAGALVVVLAYIPLAVPADHLSWLRWKTIVIVSTLGAVLALLFQAVIQSREDHERDTREISRDETLNRLVGFMEAPSGAPAPPAYPHIFTMAEITGVTSAIPSRPQLMFTPTQEPGPKWASQTMFEVTHIKGDAAQYIEIDPIQSARGGNLWIRFDQIPLLDAHHRSAGAAFWLDIGGRRIDSMDKAGNLRFVFFIRDARLQHKQSVTYPVTLRFRHGTDRLAEHFWLTWDETKQKLGVSPWN